MDNTKKFTKIWVKFDESPEVCAECPLMDTLSDFPNCYCSITDELIDNPMESGEEECPLRSIESYNPAESN